MSRVKEPLSGLPREAGRRFPAPSVFFHRFAGIARQKQGKIPKGAAPARRIFLLRAIPVFRTSRRQADAPQAVESPHAARFYFGKNPHFPGFPEAALPGAGKVGT